VLSKGSLALSLLLVASLAQADITFQPVKVDQWNRITMGYNYDKNRAVQWKYDPADEWGERGPQYVRFGKCDVYTHDCSLWSAWAKVNAPDDPTVPITPVAAKCYEDEDWTKYYQLLAEQPDKPPIKCGTGGNVPDIITWVIGQAEAAVPPPPPPPPQYVVGSPEWFAEQVKRQQCIIDGDAACNSRAFKMSIICGTLAVAGPTTGLAATTACLIGVGAYADYCSKVVHQQC
jgi:hypothetical protein